MTFIRMVEIDLEKAEKEASGLNLLSKYKLGGETLEVLIYRGKYPVKSTFGQDWVLTDMCIGNNAPLVEKALRRGDYLSALVQLVAAIGRP